LDLSVSQDVAQVNTLTGQIAKLNGQISGLQGLNQDARCPALQNLDWVRFTLELEAYMEEVRRLVMVLYRAP
jgi:hypothetical protein